ncbi:ATP-grasp domain-containing protein [Candidatus Uabimicrobium amorphum]|uniref:ATP-grasp domain-containing protein n=1 Tax=Uabimicrobium amorphum TaxID=2596890 RepID=A0A5S9IQR9_UABAM|nr:ATP-grasp domain-containing protein [Candidatus Uabimicrobium amorphum]BBM85916.1 hypothetical protein UABAM_04298 [Candidatus Uabimicrobium amorphum]
MVKKGDVSFIFLLEKGKEDVVMRKITLVHLRPNSENLSYTAIKLTSRMGVLKRLAVFCEFSIVEFTSDEILQSPVGSLHLMKGSQAVWWFGCMSFAEETQSLYNAIKKHLQSLGMEDIPIYDSPQHIKAVFNLHHSYSRLKRIGIPQPRTEFFSLTAAEEKFSEEQLRELFRECLDMPFPQTFMRTYYGTEKIHPGRNVAYTKKELCLGAARLVYNLGQQHQDIGGLALRELVDVQCIHDKAKRNFFNREFRVFIVNNKPAMWFCDVPLDRARKLLPNEKLWELGALTPEQHRDLYGFSAQIGKTFSLRLIVADFVILKNGGVMLLETNPGHCSGWPHFAAHVGVYARFIRQILQLPDFDRQQMIDITTKVYRDLHNEELWGLDTLYGFYP